MMACQICATIVFLVTLCIVSKVTESSCRDECSCQDNQCAACYATGYNERVCERSCSVGCLDGLCDAHTGVCFRNRCKDNFVGKNCSTCLPGKFGMYCLHDCPQLCVTCSSNISCDVCISGYFGEMCDRRCPEGCVGDLCTQTRECYLCKPNFRGVFCDDCSPNCLSCSSYNTCTECMPGYHGKSCQLKCSQGCLDNKCNQGNGTCNQGCKPEFKGDFCQECVKGRYGTNCSASCSSTCQSYDVETIGWITAASLLATVTVVSLGYNILQKRRLAHKDSIQNNILTGTRLDINTADLEMATFLSLSEGTLSSAQNQQSAVSELPGNTTRYDMDNGDVNAHGNSGPYERSAELREQNRYTGKHTNATSTSGPYENVAAAASDATDSDVRTYEQLTSARGTLNYRAPDEF